MREKPTRIFVSYAHEDEVWRNALFKQSLYTTFGMYSVWTDDRIEPGASWEEAIEKALQQATIAILLVSKHYLASVYIARKELPVLLKKRVLEGLKLLWIPIGNIESLQQDELAMIQAAYSLKRPLPARPNSDPSALSKVVDDVRYNIEAAIDPIGVPLMRDLSKRYTSFSMIGQSDLSIVYRAHDWALNREVAIKTPIDEQKFVDFAHSARDAARIANEPNFVKLYDAILMQRPPYCVMQYIDGQNLRAWIESDRRRPLPIVIRILSTVTRALIAAHALGISYGNLKPSNIVLAKNNEPFILPMGRRVNECRGCRWLDEFERRSPDDEDIAYLTPEQFDENIETVSEELSDQYMLGLLAYELITGNLPPTIGGAPPTPTALREIRSRGSAAFSTLPLVSDLRTDCSDFMARMIQRMTSRKPTERYASLTDLLIDVRRQEDVLLAYVRESYARCMAEQAATGRSFFKAVYNAFFAQREDAKPLFKNLGQRQYEILENAVVSLFAFYEQERTSPPNEPNVLTQAAKKHGRHEWKIGLDFYAPFIKSLIDTACGTPTSTDFIFDPRCRCDEAFRDRVRAAWQEVLRPGVEYMKSMY